MLAPSGRHTEAEFRVGSRPRVDMPTREDDRSAPRVHFSERGLSVAPIQCEPFRPIEYGTLVAFAEAETQREGRMAVQTFVGNAVDHPTARPVRELHHTWPRNPIVALWSTMVGKKVVMAVTGVVLVGFVVGHMLGNLKIFLGADAIDRYAVFLRTMGDPLFPYGGLLWVVRIVLLICVALHVTVAVQLTRMSWAARPEHYETKRSIATTYAALTARSSGMILVAFVVFHLLHLTAGRVGFRAGEFQHLAVYHNVVTAFGVWWVALFYVVAMACLCLHLDHGVWSMLQTLGWSDARSMPFLRVVSRGVAFVVFFGFISVPVAVLAGWVR